jgi:hypothetical protein
MSTSRAIYLVCLMLAAAAAEASFWISDFTGPAENYRLKRADKVMQPEQLMLLQAGDMIFVDDEDGSMVLVNERDEHTVLTRMRSPFTVPVSREPPGLLANIGGWVVGWWSTRASQSSITVSAVSKGELDPVPRVAVRKDNRLLAGNRAVRVAWLGGSPPFAVELRTSAGELLAQVESVSGYAVTLPACELEQGTELQLNISGTLGESVFHIAVVNDDQLPPSAQSVMGLDVPEQVRFGHLAFLLSAYENWRFEAMQLAHNYQLDQLEQRLLTGDWPEMPPSEIELRPSGKD